MDAASDLQGTRTRDGGIWSATLNAGTDTRSCLVSQLVARSGAEVVIEVFAQMASGGAPPPALCLLLDVPADDYAGGNFELAGVTGALPVSPAAAPHLRSGAGRQATLRQRAGGRGIALQADRQLPLLIQDGRQWGPHFTLLATLNAGATDGRRAVRQRFVLRALQDQPTAVAPPAATLTLHADRESGRFEGFGGNFCFGLDTGAAEMTRRLLRPPVARVRMHLDDLPPPSGPVSHATLMNALVAADRPWNELWQGLEMAAALRKQGARILISSWRMPAWLLEAPPRHDQNRVPREMYPLMAEAIAAYLDYLRLTRGVEPETFSFNEPDWGANVIFSAHEYRDALLAVEAALTKYGVRTRLLLGDLANARTGTSYLEPALAAPTLLRNAAALSFHAWGYAAPSDYAAWSELAKRLRLPLIVAEAGADPDWQRVDVQHYDYALRELALYQQLLANARPQVVLHWEYGDNHYAVLAHDKRQGWRHGERLAFQKQWIAYTPPGALLTACETADTELMATAFAMPSRTRRDWTLHIGNFGRQRALALVGLPRDVARLQSVTTSQGRLCVPRSGIRVRHGQADIILAGASFTTLTTLPLLPHDLGGRQRP
jgi:hypothetical protein